MKGQVANARKNLNCNLFAQKSGGMSFPHPPPHLFLILNKNFFVEGISHGQGVSTPPNSPQPSNHPKKNLTLVLSKTRSLYYFIFRVNYIKDRLGFFKILFLCLCSAN